MVTGEQLAGLLLSVGLLGFIVGIVFCISLRLIIETVGTRQDRRIARYAKRYKRGRSPYTGKREAHRDYFP